MTLGIPFSCTYNSLEMHTTVGLYVVLVSFSMSSSIEHTIFFFFFLVEFNELSCFLTQRIMQKISVETSPLFPFSLLVSVLYMTTLLVVDLLGQRTGAEEGELKFSLSSSTFYVALDVLISASDISGFLSYT